MQCSSVAAALLWACCWGAIVPSLGQPGEPVEQGAPQDTPCGDGVLDYISGAKAHETIIPYTTECVLEYQRNGHVLAPPHTAAVHLKGIPKTGTTWAEFFIRTLLLEVCQSGLYSGCSSQGARKSAAGPTRSVELFFPADPTGSAAGKDFAIVGFYVHFKHVLTYNSSCEHLTPKLAQPCKRRVSFLELLKNPVSMAALPWLRCASEGPYEDIRRCVPSGMVEARFPRSTNRFLEETASKMGIQIAISSNSEPMRKYIYTVRDPRDAGVSLAHFSDLKLSPDLMLSRFGCKSQVAAAAFFYYWQVERQGKVYPTMELMYRKAMDNPFETFEATLRHFGLRATREIVEKVIHATSFDTMKRLENRNLLPGINRPGSDRRKIRKGVYGGYKEELSPETIELCNQDMRRALPEHLLHAFGV
eukprot:CAMPEP_0117669026 /NCGR_PEP_ID=MMETSP0804-20121206/11888_1 /TAXON_ID=1074897 /ORGANISM="Tetraselmis astigmatica, Strain CCMP880" /LENGTH=417 /DNA_ID=CAMNT_0005477007 /DNA_START=57 /DNA_END=1310 /DNA_ORIENTATION=+